MTPDSTSSRSPARRGRGSTSPGSRGRSSGPGSVARTASCGQPASCSASTAWAMRRKADLVHCPATLGPMWTPMPTVLTIHDMLYWSHPEFMVTPFYTRPVMWMERRGAGNATRIITDSQVSADEIVQFLDFPASGCTSCRLRRRRTATPTRGARPREPAHRQRPTPSLQELGRADPGTCPRRRGRQPTSGGHRVVRPGDRSAAAGHRRRRPARVGRGAWLGGASTS